MRTRVVASLLVSASFLLGPVVVAPPAHADEVATAQRRVDTLQVLVRQTTTRLVAGTRQWEHDQASLRATQRQLAAVAAKVRREEAIADAGRERVAVVARRMYMSPVQDELRMAMSMDAEQVMQLVRTQGQLQQIAASDSEVVRRATTARSRLAHTRVEAAQLTQAAQRLADRSRDQLRKLNALADSTAAQLAAAEDGLVRARARKAARLAALARARAARNRLRYTGGGALCTNRSTAGMSNGNLDPAALCPLWGAPGHRLRADAARAFNALSKYHAKTTGSPLCVTDSYRSYSQQVDVYHRKPGLAAVPGTSNHGWGRAVDLCGGVQSYGSPAFRWMKANAGRFGWHHPGWAEPWGSKPEAWHWEYGG